VKQYLGRVSGSEKVNMMFGWHGTTEHYCFENAANGIFIPPPVPEQTLKQLEECRTGGKRL